MGKTSIHHPRQIDHVRVPSPDCCIRLRGRQEYERVEMRRYERVEKYERVEMKSRKSRKGGRIGKRESIDLSSHIGAVKTKYYHLR